MKNLFFVSILLILGNSVFCKITNIPRISQQNKKDKVIDYVLDQVSGLPEVKAYFREHGNLKAKAAVLLYQDIDANSSRYWVKVGINRPDIFVTTYNFFVDPKTFKIYYFDTMDDSDDPDNAILTLRQWRKWRSDSRFKELHIFRKGSIILVKTTT
jgi:hypothetical protein